MAVVTLRPNATDTAGGWLASAGTHHAAIDDDPDAPDTADYIENPLTAGATTVLGLGTASNVTEGTSVTLSVYGVMVDDPIDNPSFVVQLRKADDTVLATVSFPENTAESKRTAVAAVSLNQTDVDGLELAFVSTGASAGNRRVYAAEVELTYIGGGGPLNRTLLHAG